MATPSDKAADTPGPDELGQWMALYGPVLRRYFARKANPADADDLVQDVFLRLQARADRAPTQNVEGLLFAIARGVLIDRYRVDATYNAHLQEFLDDAEVRADELSPERIVEGRQDFARAIEAILKLPPRMRSAVTMHRFEKLSYSAIAKRMGVTKAAVQDLMSRAFERIVRDLEDGE